ncbi:MAG TPA: hypothetical protein PKY78_07040 [Candidatus Omnitrophota bacterium]|nr:hypothetical protein [Candidatus Omnitrophota bacterium]HPS20721.1 hypothetical protein [Candidatus Omnitrophota bacterium]
MIRAFIMCVAMIFASGIFILTADCKTTMTAKGKTQPAENVTPGIKPLKMEDLKKEHTYLTVKGEWAALTKEYMESFLKKKNDPKAVDADFRSGRALKLKENIEVKVEKMDAPLGLIEIKPVGKNFTLWTTPAGIRKK